jgi:hypothetical protein
VLSLHATHVSDWDAIEKDLAQPSVVQVVRALAEGSPGAAALIFACRANLSIEDWIHRSRRAFHGEEP